MIFLVELDYETVEFHIETTKKNKAVKKPENKEFKKERMQKRRQRLTKKEEADADQQRRRRKIKNNKPEPLTETTNPDLPNHP